jgi:hypothetical protein
LGSFDAEASERAEKTVEVYKAALDLLRNSTSYPDSSIESTQQDVFLHRFYGATIDGEEFCVQVKVDKRSGRKDFMSVFARRKPK